MIVPLSIDLQIEGTLVHRTFWKIEKDRQIPLKVVVIANCGACQMVAGGGGAIVKEQLEVYSRISVYTISCNGDL
jgi:hypothetical protein